MNDCRGLPACAALELELREDIEYLQRRLEQMTKHRDEWRSYALRWRYAKEQGTYVPEWGFVDDRLEWETE